ncbi:Eco57I restriction-modification methylase domain-containing protein [Slackia isoflavoniconvertens]|uniref:Eco57I restriction-modification methylase domain-containing protein n=1 Tax=Slackia isoflavoniconvertens TaxID=572010 RepID=UPI003F958AD9
MEFVDRDIFGGGFIERFERCYPARILNTLLCDRTTGRNIIWADNEYEALGDGYAGSDEITADKITGLSSGVIKPRIAKEQERQSQRTKSRAEVFTPSWLCNQMNNDIDSVWFGRRDVFSTEEAGTWRSNPGTIEFPKGKGLGWHAYVESLRLEITCGEAPFVCSRYDTVTGDVLPVSERIGFLDRKLRVVTEKTKTRKEWVKRALDALSASYGFEYQGDNLLIARINVLETFCEHHRDRWGSAPTDEEIDRAAWIVSWNFWQMNGFTDAVPTSSLNATVESTLGSFEEPIPTPVQPSLFDMFDDLFVEEAANEPGEEEPAEKTPLCVIYDWRDSEPLEFASLKGRACPMGKKFYAIIGNPPYQEQTEGNGRSNPIYPAFMDESYALAERVELITPGRFLFNAGQTPPSWNEKMLNDKHLKVLFYKSDSSEVFSNTDIKGGVAVTLRDEKEDFGAIGVFTAFPALNGIIKKVAATCGATLMLDSIFGSQRLYKFSDKFYADNADDPSVQELLGPGDRIKIVSSLLEKLPAFFLEERMNDDDIKILGRVANRREYRYIAREYLRDNAYIDAFKLFIPEANNSGRYGETLAEPLLGRPGEATTDTFLNAGPYPSEIEPLNLCRYYKTKFFRALLGAKKVTQHSPSQVWKTIPLQDFTNASDIDWNQPIASIDAQLYAKYGLSDDEIAFIESHVKEMD